MSNHLPVVSGVPQGSILGPLLFLIFINDLPASVLSSIVLLYADDTKCVLPIYSLSDCLRLQNDLTRLSEWCTTWNLALNEDKCCSVHFTCSTRRPCTTSSYCLNEKAISSKTQYKDLGIIVSGDLSWHPHYQLITSRAYKMLGLLRRVFSNSIAVSAKRSLYISLVRSQLLYCSPIWHPYLLADVKSLELVQRRATKFIMNYSTLDYRNRLIHLNLLPLMIELELADIIFFVKSIKAPTDHFNIFDFVQFSSLHTRSSSNLKLKHSLSSNKFERNSYFNRIPRLWNSLPSVDINLPLSTIKSKLRKYFWDHFISNFSSDNICSYHLLCLCHMCSKNPVNMHFGSFSL